jgi:deoxyhypusine synthase
MSANGARSRDFFFPSTQVCIINFHELQAWPRRRRTPRIAAISSRRKGFLDLSGEAMPKQKKTVTGRVLHDPVKDKLRPIFPLDLSKCRTIDELVRAMGDTAYTGRQIGDAADVLEAMARDKDCFVVMTLAGALTVGKMGLVFCDLIESGIVKAIVSTGALMAHGLVEATGLSHFRYDPSKMDDRELFAAGYNRVYDSLEPETNLDHVEEVVDHILDEWDADEVVCSWKLHRRIGEYLKKQSGGRGILKSAYEHNVPVFVPAFSDSELGIDFALHKIARQRSKRPLLRFDPFEDFETFADTMMATKRMGIFTVGGGVPRNWSQQFGVYAELMARRGYKKLPLKRYNYGLRICPEPVHWGGLSGSTYTEAVSWGKFVPPEEGGRFAEVFEDATVALPLVVGAVLQRIGYFTR